MDAKTTLIKALAAGALLMMRPNPEAGPQAQEAPEAYLALKRMIRERYKQVNVDLLDDGPGSAERQQAMAQQLQAAGVVDDEEIVQQAKETLQAIDDEESSTLWASEPADEPAQLK
jgi:hypothetical protein